MRIENRDYANQQKREKPMLTVPRPGHADLAGSTKYRLDDMRTVLDGRSLVRVALMRNLDERRHDRPIDFVAAFSHGS